MRKTRTSLTTMMKTNYRTLMSSSPTSTSLIKPSQQNSLKPSLMSKLISSHFTKASNPTSRSMKKRTRKLLILCTLSLISKSSKKAFLKSKRPSAIKALETKDQTRRVSLWELSMTTINYVVKISMIQHSNGDKLLISRRKMASNAKSSWDQW